MSNKMNPEIKARWVAALRSGEYKQGVSNLRNDNDTYCCLGVLCDLYSREFREPWGKVADTSRFFHFLREDNVLPIEVMSWAGLNQNGGDEVQIRGRSAELWHHNDYSRTFAEIADAIEAQL